MQKEIRQSVTRGRGFTLVELILVVGTIGMVSGALVGVVGNSYKDFKAGSDRSTLLQDGQAVLDQMIRTLRQAKAFVAVSASTDQAGYITYTTADDVSEQFKLNTTGELEHGPSPGTLSALTGDVSSLTFTCYDTNAVALTGAVEPNSVKSVQIEMTLTGAQNTATLTARVYWPIDIKEILYLFTPDRSGNEHHALVQGTEVEVVTGKVDNAFYFDGDDFLELPAVFNPAETSFSVTTWVQIYARDGTHAQFIFQQLNPGGRTLMGRLSNNRLYSILGGVASQTNAAVFDEIGVWRHLCITYSGTTLTFYIDGVARGSTARNAESSDAGFRFGAHKTTFSDAYGYWNGLIDDCRIYGVVLSQSEIEDIMAGVAVGSPLSWWKLDEISSMYEIVE